MNITITAARMTPIVVKTDLGLWSNLEVKPLYRTFNLSMNLFLNILPGFL